MTVYDKQGKLLILKKDIQLFSYSPKSEYKMDGFQAAYNNTACKGDSGLISAAIIIESPENSISIIHKNDTMNIFIKNYTAYGYELFIDSVIFSKGWYQLKNENTVSFDNLGQWVIDNKMNLKYDTCYTNLAKMSGRNIIPAVPDFSKSFKNKIPPPYEKKEAESPLITVLAENIEIKDSLGIKYFKYKFHYEGKIYSNTSVLPKNLKMGSFYQVFISFEKSEPLKILDIRSYPHGY